MWGDSFAILAAAAACFTTGHTTFSVMPSPQTDPFLLTHRNSLPAAIAAEVVQASTVALSQSGTGTVAHVRGFPDQVDDYPVVVLPLLKSSAFRSAVSRRTQSAAEE